MSREKHERHTPELGEKLKPLKSPWWGNLEERQGREDKRSILLGQSSSNLEELDRRYKYVEKV